MIKSIYSLDWACGQSSLSLLYNAQSITHMMDLWEK
jgi:hypothetical protein